MTLRANWLPTIEGWGPSDLRQLLVAAGRTEGVADADDFEVTESPIGLSIDVAEGVAYVQGDDPAFPHPAGQGVYQVASDDAVNSASFITGGLPVADETNPTIHRIVLRVYDEEAGDGDSLPRLEVIAGTPTAAATPAGGEGAAAVPDTALWLANVRVKAAAGVVDADDVFDARVLSEVGQQNLSSRADAVETTASIADGAMEDLEFTMAPSAAILKVATDVAARVVLYATDADRDADDLTTRTFGTNPTGDHGVLLDLLTTGGDLSWRRTPAVIAFNGDTTPTDQIYATVLNDSGSTDTVQVTVTYLPLED